LDRAVLAQRRRRAREIALQLIYELNLRPDLSFDEAFSSFPFETEDVEIIEYARRLVLEVIEKETEIDEILRQTIIGWRPERMVAVDRAAICLALGEGFFGKMVPVAVAISEVVELTKIFGTEESSRFVNGVLGKIARQGAEKNEKPDN
jgi:N utilization substance protein B